MLSMLATRSVGRQWTGLWVDGIQTGLSWDHIPRGRWSHVHFSGQELVTGEVFAMSRVTSVGAPNPGPCVSGRLSELYIWGRTILASEVEVIANGFDWKNYIFDQEVLPRVAQYNREFAALNAVFLMEEGQGACVQTGSVIEKKYGRPRPTRGQMYTTTPRGGPRAVMRSDPICGLVC